MIPFMLMTETTRPAIRVFPCTNEQCTAHGRIIREDHEVFFLGCDSCNQTWVEPK